MKTIKDNRALATALACGSIPLIILLFGKILGLIGTLIPGIKFILPIVSLLLFLLPSILFLLALVVPNMDMLDRRFGQVSISTFYKPTIKSISYYAVAGLGLVISFYLIFIIPGFLYFLAFAVLAILYFYFLAMTKLATQFLGREKSPYGRAIHYHLFAACGLVAVALTLALQIFLPYGIIKHYMSSELLTCLGGMVGVGFMVGRSLQSQYDEEQFYQENYPTEVPS